MPKTVLVPLDGTADAERAIPVAAVVAARCHADTVLVAASTTDDEAIAPGAGSATRHAVGNVMKAEVVRSVTVADALRAIADDSNDPVVCMATHARVAVGRALFGSVAEDVIRHLAVPAVLVGPSCFIPPDLRGPVLVCHDGSTAGDAVADIAADWAVALGTSAVLVHVFHPLDVRTAEDPEAVVAAAAQRMRQAFVDVDCRVVRGYSPAGTIVGLIDDLEPALVALGTHARIGMGRMLLGSVATAVVHRSSVPALVVHPGRAASS